MIWGRTSQLAKTLARHPAFPVVSGLLALCAYLGVAWFILDPDAVWSPDEGAKLLQLQSLRQENGRLAYDITYPGRQVDPNLSFADPAPVRGLLRVQSGKLYFERLPLFALLVRPLFRWFGFHGLYLLPALSGAGCGVLTVCLFPRDERRLVMWVLTALGSPILIYAVLCWEHTLAAFLGLVGIWLALRLSAGKGSRPLAEGLAWTVVGTLLGTSAYLRLEMTILGAALLLACVLLARRHRWGPIWAGIVLGLMLWGYVWLHQAMYGKGLPGNATYLFYPFTYLAQAGWRAIPDLLVGPSVDEAIDTGWLGIVWSAAALIALALSLDPGNSPGKRALRLLALGITAIAAAVFLFTPTSYRSAHGLLFTTPWALLGLCRAAEVWQRASRAARIIVLSTVLGLVGYVVGIVILRADSPHGGLEWGARFALTFYPLLALLAAWDWETGRHATREWVVVGAFCLLGLGFQARGLWTIQHDKQTSAALNRAIAETPEQHIVSDLWWLPFNAAPICPQKAIFVAHTPERLREWVQLASASQVTQFGLVTFGNAWQDSVVQTLQDYWFRVVSVRNVEGFAILRIEIETG